jgi:Pyruvate/2-oxoacid:ferredoxin oxidoreductase delta subunit
VPRQRRDQARPGKGFEFNLDYCKGCGVCVSECPCGAIEMVPEAL